LTTPVYGATAASPLLVGGRITGVDESIRVEIRQRTGDVLLGRFCCIPAGGNNTAWSARVPFHGATDRVVTVVASTGGHLAEVERFAVTGFRPVPPGK
jgi:Immunoglobulin-like domain of bacterial spore germination.